MLQCNRLTEKLHLLAESKNWKEILDLSKTLPVDEKRKILWSWPTKGDLQDFKKILNSLGISNILSIGCGSGLFEWIIQESIGVAVFGLEIDELWWNSCYAVKSFIPLNFVGKETNMMGDLMQTCCRTENWNFALMFCYFNNRIAFYEYLSQYEGSWLILIGPSVNISIHTDPSPLELNFKVKEKLWTLHTSFTLSNNDLIAFYTNS